MNTRAPSPSKSWLPSAVGRERLLETRGEPFLVADWDRALMLHYEVVAEALQPFVPFDLDLRDGKAYVSLVAFTMRGMRFRRGGGWTSWMLRPIGTHEFLNVRTYVKHQGEAGIHFLREWLPNRLSVLLGRPVFGLPYEHGETAYRHAHEQGWLQGSVANCQGARLSYRASVASTYAPCLPGSLAEFLMERYSAFTDWRGWRRRFRVWHPPWLQAGINAAILDDSLIARTFPWFSRATFVAANYSPGAPYVWMSRPQTLNPVPIK